MAAGTWMRVGLRAQLASALARDWVAAAALVAVAAAYYLIPSTALSLVLLAALAYLIWQRSDLAVALIPLTVPLWMLPKHLHLVRSLEFSLGETAIALCAAIVLLQEVQRAPARAGAVSLWRSFVPSSPFEWPALVFLFAGALATLAAQFQHTALEWFRWVLIEPILFYWLILQRAQGPAGAARLALAAVAAGVMLALLGLCQILFRPGDLAVALNVAGRPHLVRAVYGNQNNLALFLDRAIPMALALALLPGWLRALAATPAVAPLRAAGRAAPRRLGLWAALDLPERRWPAALALGSVLMLYILYRTQSRGGEIATAVCLAVLFIYWQRRRPWVLAAGGLVVLAAGFVARHRIYDTLTGGHGLTNNARVSIWLSALRMVRDNPYFGVGPDNFLYYYSDDAACAPGHIANHYYSQTALGHTPVNFERCVSHPHNMFLDLWLSTGFLGFLAGLTLLALFAVLGLRAFRSASALWRGPLLAALLAMLAFAVHGQVDNSYFLPDLSVLFWLCLGIVALWTRAVGAGEQMG